MNLQKIYSFCCLWIIAFGCLSAIFASDIERDVHNKQVTDPRGIKVQLEGQTIVIPPIKYLNGVMPPKSNSSNQSISPFRPSRDFVMDMLKVWVDDLQIVSDSNFSVQPTDYVGSSTRKIYKLIDSKSSQITHLIKVWNDFDGPYSDITLASLLFAEKNIISQIPENPESFKFSRIITAGYGTTRRVSDQELPAQGEAYFVTLQTYMPGETLRNLIDRFDSLPHLRDCRESFFQDLLQIFRKFGWSLGIFVARFSEPGDNGLESWRTISHGDLYYSNIIWDRASGRLSLIDFDKLYESYAVKYTVHHSKMTNDIMYFFESYFYYAKHILRENVDDYDIPLFTELFKNFIGAVSYTTQNRVMSRALRDYLVQEINLSCENVFAFLYGYKNGSQILNPLWPANSDNLRDLQKRPKQDFMKRQLTKLQQMIQSINIDEPIFSPYEKKEDV